MLLEPLLSSRIPEPDWVCVRFVSFAPGNPMMDLLVNAPAIRPVVIEPETTIIDLLPDSADESSDAVDAVTVFDVVGAPPPVVADPYPIGLVIQ